MAEPKSRVVIVGKLFLLVGLPLAAITTVFGAGVHWGNSYRAEILRFEKDWLGMDVQVPLVGDGHLSAMLANADAVLPGTDPAAIAAGTAAQPAAATGPEAASGAEAAAPVVPEPTAPVAPAPLPTPQSEPAVAKPAQPEAVELEQPKPSLGVVYPLAVAPTLPSDLESAYNRSRVLKVKVLVDRAYVEAHPNWLADVDGVIAAASRNYSELLGMQLQLWGVVEWQVSPSGLDIEQLHADLRTRHREGADLLLGISGRGMDGSRRNGWSETPARRTLRNTAFAVVLADANRPDRLLRAVLHEVGHCFGAQDVTDPASEAWKKGSIMSYANVPSDTSPWFDPENTRIMLERKHKEIESEGSLNEGHAAEHQDPEEVGQ
jgi:hypothetical protein